MEGAGEESLFLHDIILERAVGGTRWSADLDRQVLHTVPLLSVVGSVTALCLVVLADESDEKDFPHSRPMDRLVAHTRRDPVDQ